MKRLMLSSKKQVDVEEVEESRLLSGLSGQQPVERISGEFAHKGFYLTRDFDWVMGLDDENSLVLVPLKRG